MPDWIISLIVMLAGGWALAEYVSVGLAAVFVVIMLVITLALAFGGGRARR